MQQRAPTTPCSSSSSAGVRPWAARHASFSARCSDRWACRGAPRSRAQPATVASWSAGTARTEWIAAPTRACGASRSEEARLDPFDRDAEAAREVARVEQRDADAGLGRRLDHRLAHGVGIGVARGAVVEVVELADAGDAGQRHLPEDPARERPVAVGVQPLGDRVHVLAPGPEGAAAAVRAPAQRPVEGVRVGVREAGQREPAEHGRLAARRSRLHASDPLTVELDQHAGLGAVAPEPRVLGPEARQAPSRIGIRTPWASATSSARS
jgi:hypothetical protein